MENQELLCDKFAAELYERYARDLPIVDYHNHLSVSVLSENLPYTDIYEIWLAPDPYKHRAMRMCGVEERLITGDASPEEKFKAWCKVAPRLIGTPLYTWSKTELCVGFGIDTPICEEIASEIWETANTYLKENAPTPKDLLSSFGVKRNCPCVGLTQDLSVFKGLCGTVPSLRGDSILAPESVFLEELSKQGGKINNLDDYKHIVAKRLDDFCKVGCVWVDHALDSGFRFCTEGDADAAFLRLLQGHQETGDAVLLFSDLLLFLGGEYAKRNMVMQLHIGAVRSTSSRLRSLAGAQGGFAAIGTDVDIISLTTFFDCLEQGEFGIPKTVLFTLNPTYNQALSVLSGSYSKDGVSGLITQGPAWWWCDHKNGITGVLDSVSNYGLLSNFVGMTTDSRSVLSFVRHDYFRRILCSFLSEKVKSRELICREEELASLIHAVCYENAEKTFQI